MRRFHASSCRTVDSVAHWVSESIFFNTWRVGFARARNPQPDCRAGPVTMSEEIDRHVLRKCSCWLQTGLFKPHLAVHSSIRVLVLDVCSSICPTFTLLHTVVLLLYIQLVAQACSVPVIFWFFRVPWRATFQELCDCMNIRPNGTDSMHNDSKSVPMKTPGQQSKTKPVAAPSCAGSF